jgi:hypothetical protein
MLDNTSTTILQNISAPPVPRITGSYLARNRLPTAARVQLVQRMLGGEDPKGLTKTQACLLARVPRQRLYEANGTASQRRSSAWARAFRRMSEAERIEAIRQIGSDQVWSALQAAI